MNYLIASLQKELYCITVLNREAINDLQLVRHTELALF